MISASQARDLTTDAIEDDEVIKGYLNIFETLITEAAKKRKREVYRNFDVISVDVLILLGILDSKGYYASYSYSSKGVLQIRISW